MGIAKLIILVMVSGLVIPEAHAKLHSALGFQKSLHDTQDSNGSVADKPFSPLVSVGYNVNLFDSRFGFSPQFGYIHTKVSADDSYGKQKIHQLFLNWDFLYVPEFYPQMAFRFGLGNFMKRIHGEGGTVTIPNGNGTDKARRPSKTQTSFTGTLNIGADLNFGIPVSDYISDLGLRVELFTFRPLSMEHRSYAFMFGVVAYF